MDDGVDVWDMSLLIFIWQLHAIWITRAADWKACHSLEHSYTILYEYTHLALGIQQDHKDLVTHKISSVKLVNYTSVWDAASVSYDHM